MPLPAFIAPIAAAIAGGVAGSATSKFLGGSGEKHQRVSTLRKEQEPLYQQAVKAGLGRGAGGAFGESADYYRDLLSDDSSTFQDMIEPEMRRYREQIIPDLAEQFAGMGSGALSSSGFRNAAVNAGTDLSERLGAIRAKLRQQGAQGLLNVGGYGLQNYSQDVMTQPGSEGFLSQAAPAIGQAATSYAGNWLNSRFNNDSIKGTTSPYGGNNYPSTGNFRDVQFGRT